MPLSSDGKLEAIIRILGRVKGVGFRPFVYRIAIKYRLKGYVINLGDSGVEVIVEGTERQVKRFLGEIKENAPEVSEIEEIGYEVKPYRGRFKEFLIDKSQNRGKVASGMFPPDIGICPQCIDDMNNPSSRWYGYPFTACAWCGPRFTGVRALPYDRERTHMHEFPMCGDCISDYYDSMNRRFDAQGMTCGQCGPTMALYDSKGRKLEIYDVFKETARLILEGNIVAVKGIGGVHIASLATSDDVVEELRSRKKRPYQPFALMSPNLEAVEIYAEFTEYEKNLMLSWRRPIVLLKKKDEVVSELVAPGLDRVGVMLPYSGIQSLLFKHLSEPALIMTSGNRPGLPMVITNEAAFRELGGFVDYFLLHNREIMNRCDDSVLRVIRDYPSFTRRSRGYVPDPIDIPFSNGTCVALGAELRNTAAIATKGKVFMTQYLGDITNLESLDYEKQALLKMRDMLNITRNPDVIACDLHPEYMTSQLSKVISQDIGVDVIRSQHHHAHAVSVMAENMVSPEEEMIGIVLDGAGYGKDMQIWGGEILKLTYSSFERVGQLEYVPMPGGDLCAYYPYRMLIASLTNVVTDDVIRDITKNHIEKALPHGQNELELILKQSIGSDVLKTSSAGRFLDAVASLLDLTQYRTYEGEPAMRLEALASHSVSNLDIEPIISFINGKYVLNTSNILYYYLINKNKYKYADIAHSAQKYLAEGVSNMAIMASEEMGIKSVVVSGGVLVNESISNIIHQILSSAGIKVFFNKKVPPGDGGTALGQCCVALSSVM
jgi:hydrogenase maturation protein HypF